MAKSIQIFRDVVAGAFAQNISWFPEDYYVDDLGKFRFNICVSSEVVVEYTIDGTNWIKINGGVALTPNCGYGFDLYVRASDTINVRTPTVGGTTVILGRMDSIKDEG